MEATTTSNGIWNKIFKTEGDLEHFRFAVISAALIVVGCLGGITVGQGAVESIVALSLILIPTMATLSILLAVGPVKWILNASVIAITLDLILLFYYMFT